MRIFITILFASLFTGNVHSQKCWKPRNVNYIITKVACKVNTNIIKYDAWQLNYKKFKKIAAKAKPQSFNVDNVFIELPFENASIRKFRIYDSETMTPDLAKQFPNIKSYYGECVDDKLIKARIDFNDLGFHALISNSQGLQWLLEPFCVSTKLFYCSYNKTDYNSEREPFNEERRR